MAIEILRNKKNEIKFIHMGELDNKFVGINVAGKIVDIDDNILSSEEPEEIENEDLPEELKRHYHLVAEEKNGFDGIVLEDMNILNDFVFRGKTHAEISRDRYNEPITDNNDGWTAGDKLRSLGCEGLHRQEGEKYLNDYKTDKRIYPTLPPLIQLLVRMNRYGEI
jgi:heat shock protein HspQ